MTSYAFFSPLRDTVYRRMFCAQVVALIGTGLATVALALLAYDLAGGSAGAVLGAALALKMVAYVTIAPLAGAVATRVDRRRLLIALDLGRAAAIGCMAIVTEVWQVYALIFLLNACSAGFTPTFQAAIPDILPDEDRYTRALSLSRLAYDLENLLSPTLAGLALIAVGYNALFAANATAFLISAALILSLRLPRAAPLQRDDSIRHGVVFGIRGYLATPRLRGLLALSLAVAAAGAVVIVNTVVYVRGFLGLGETETALALAAAGAGSMTTALALPRLLDRLSDRPVMLAGGAALAVGLGLGTLKPGFSVLLVLWFFIGAGLSAIQTPAGRLLRRSSAEADRPAFYAAQFALSHACWLIAYPAAGWLGDMAGLGTAFAAMAGFVVAGTAAASVLWPAYDPSEVEHVHHARDHGHFHVHDEHHQHEHEGWEGPEPHSHPHRHEPLRHRHPFVIDHHHPTWPARGA